jgi:glycine betaine/proline transport system ATP-binding protein
MRAQHIGMVFQHMALMPHRSVRDNVAYPLEIRGVPKSKRWAVSEHTLGPGDLDGYEDRLPASCPAGCSSASASRARWPPTPRSC